MNEWLDQFDTFSFERPEFLLLLLIPILLAFREWSTYGHPLVLPLDHAKKVRRPWLKYIVKSMMTIPQLLLVIAIIIICGPRIASVPKEERVMNNILFCLDLSGSMGGQFGGNGTRYDEAMRAIKTFTELENREGDAFGLTVFGNEVLHWVPVTRDLSAINYAVPFIKPGILPRWFGGTEIGKALTACVEVLKKQEEGDRMIILLSDGMSADLSRGRDDKVASLLAEENITVYVISIASRIHTSMQKIAQETGGEVFSANDPEALGTVINQIDSMEKSRFKQTAAMNIDFFEPFTFLGLCFLGLYVPSLFGLRFTPW